MRKLSFVVVLIGLFILSIFLETGERKIDSYEDLESLTVNQKVVLEGFVENSRVFDDFEVLSLNGIDVLCSCTEDYVGKNVFVKGVVSEYLDKKQIELLEIRFLD